MSIAGLAIWVSPPIANVRNGARASSLVDRTPAPPRCSGRARSQRNEPGRGTLRQQQPLRGLRERHGDRHHDGTDLAEEANCLPETNWKAANQAAAGLKAGDCGLTDGSSPGDWRLPTKLEWEATISKAVALACTFDRAPSLTNDAGTACYGDGTGSSPVGVGSVGYWSSTLGEIHPLLTIFPTTSVASFANLHHGDVITIESMLNFGVWPVRGGTRP